MAAPGAALRPLPARPCAPRSLSSPLPPLPACARHSPAPSTIVPAILGRAGPRGDPSHHMASSAPLPRRGSRACEGPAGLRPLPAPRAENESERRARRGTGGVRRELRDPGSGSEGVPGSAGSRLSRCPWICGVPALKVSLDLRGPGSQDAEISRVSAARSKLERLRGVRSVGPKCSEWSSSALLEPLQALPGALRFPWLQVLQHSPHSLVPVCVTPRKHHKVKYRTTRTAKVSMDVTSPPLSLHDNGFSMVPPGPLGTSQEEMEKLKEELQMWEKIIKEAENVKTSLLLSKCNAEEECDRAEKQLRRLREEEEQRRDRIIGYQKELFQLNQERTELKKENKKLKEELEECNSGNNPAKQLEIKKKVAEMKLKFTHLKEVKAGGGDMNMNTHCVFGAATKIPFRLNKNQALLTFEDEEVAQRLTRMSKHCVNLDNRTANVTVKPFELDVGFLFELHITISGKKIRVSEIPELPIPKSWMRDKLELNFYKTEQAPGGGEIQDVTYTPDSGTAVITFLKPGASNKFVGHTKYLFYAEGKRFNLSVSPYFNFHLGKFQPYCRVSKKTILLKGIPEVEEDEESMQDMIEIHFQKPSNGGGEIEKIKYISRGAAYVCFEEDTENATSEITGNS